MAKKGRPVRSKSPTEDGGKKEKAPMWVTPEGRFSYPHLAEPDTQVRAKFKPDNKYKCDLLVDKSVWRDSEEAAALKDAMLEAAQARWGKKVIQSLADFDHPLKDTDKIRDSSENTRGCILLRAKSGFAPFICGPTKNEDGKYDALSEKQVKGIKGGDWGRFMISIATYELHGDPGVNFYLNIVQYKQPGDPLGSGYSAALDMLGEMEVTLDDLEESSDDSDDEVEEKPKRTRRTKAQIEEDEEEEKPRRGRKAKPVEEEEEQDDEEDDEVEEEEEDDDDVPVRSRKSKGNGHAADFEF